MKYSKSTDHFDNDKLYKNEAKSAIHETLQQ